MDDLSLQLTLSDALERESRLQIGDMLVDLYTKATQKTVADLRTIATSSRIVELSHLTLPEIEALTEQVAQVVPAGNIPGLILSGLTRLEGRQIPQQEKQKHLGMLFRGVRDMLDKAVYGVVFAGPAAVILGYQKLLQLAGKDVESAFPNGTWQFYLEYALREDTARHANETVGFQQKLADYGIRLGDGDTLTAWIIAAQIILQTYDRLLENEWRERTLMALLRDVAQSVALNETEAKTIHNAYSAWEAQRPYIRGQEAGNDDYPTYRQRKFDAFLAPFLASLPESARTLFVQQADLANREGLPAYQRQMSILARLEPGPYQELRVPYELPWASVAVVYRGHYMLIPASQSAADFQNARQIVTAMLKNPPAEPAGDLDLLLAGSSRASQSAIRGKADSASQSALAAFGFVPIVINWDRQNAHQPLAAIRQGRRGIGDHALTLFFTDESTVFDQSHIFFDGAWGAALAEIMTGEALSWAQYLAQLPPVASGKIYPAWLTLAANQDVRAAAERAHLPGEATAESTAIKLGPVMTLRRLFKSRNELVTVTVNDLLILYRALHGQRYKPSRSLTDNLEALAASSDTWANQASAMIEEVLSKIRHGNPAILIPMDASQASPRQRLYPTTFRNPMTDLLDWHDATLTALRDYKMASRDRQAAYSIFDERQRHYLRMIAAFGALMRKHKEVAMFGQSTSTIAIKMLAFMPDSVQRLLDEIPGQFDVLNEIIKGEEVFSNVGRVVPGSTLRRFITAKDDNEQKTLAWGVLTDDQNIVHISLRDFRPHVTVLQEHHMGALATQVTQDFLDSYVDGFNLFIRELREITTASRETRLVMAGNKGDSPSDEETAH